jgi:Fur family transcriptional regulator, peroxide stress response regulator
MFISFCLSPSGHSIIVFLGNHMLAGTSEYNIFVFIFTYFLFLTIFRMKNIRQLLAMNGLKVTPQRVAVYEAISKMKNHPNAEIIIEHIKRRNPNIAVGTVYNTLESFVEKGIIRRIKTDGDVMRYDADISMHHHLYSNVDNRIEDFYDEELNQYITKFMKTRKIPNFVIEDVNIQIMGKFNG